jgi:hypothetical protein
VLYHDDRIRTLWDGSASHDFERLTGLERLLAAFAGAHFSTHAKCPGDLCRFDCEAVTQGTPQGRIIAVRRYIFGKNTCVGFIERNGFLLPSGRELPDSFDYDFSSFIELERWTLYL